MSARYQLYVVGGSAVLSGRPLLLGADGVFHVQNGSGFESATPCRIKPPDDDGSMRILISEDDVASSPHVCVLHGPSGKGEYRLERSSIELPSGQMRIGSSALHDGWMLAEDGGRQLLRHRQAAITSHWIAVKEAAEDSQDRWTIWWYSPSPANMEDFVTYVDVDIEVLEIDERDEA